MSQPTQFEIAEYEVLYAEFKQYTESSKAPHFTDMATFMPVINSMAKDDPCRVRCMQMIRYNRYLELRTLLAPYFYELLLKNGIKL